MASNIDDCALLDIKARAFWNCKQQDVFFDVRVFNHHAHSNSKQSIASYCRKHEQEKTREYDKTVRKVEYGCFTPLVFSAVGVLDQLPPLF